MSRYDLTDFEWRVIEPLLPNKPRGVPRVDDRRVLSGIIFVNRKGLRWRDAPREYGPAKTLYNRWRRWSDKGVTSGDELNRRKGLGGLALDLRGIDAR